MSEDPLFEKISRIKKGRKFFVIPLSTNYGDEITAMGVPCSGINRAAIELPDPFHAELEDFDGDNIMIKTESYHCLKIALVDIRDVIPLEEKPKEDELGFI